MTGTGSGSAFAGLGEQRRGVERAQQRRSSDSGSGSSTGQIVVIGTDSYIVNATVDDTEIGEIADGDQVDITPSGDTTPVYGTVGSISLIGTASLRT